ncbi:MAG: hypothetical protein AMS24_02475 [Chlamydiae bacterium SM23_39]|nr:MAG: hypothetical protein AMS24_02475 [Chlamydiae bacterium SM23_39]
MDLDLSKFDKNTQKNILAWLNENFEPAIKKEIKNLIKKDPNYIKNAFCKKLSFGTGGAREKMGIGTNRLNKYTIRGMALGLANYIKSQKTKSPSVLIGFDTRNNSKNFAEETAKVLANNKIKVYIFKTPHPTPLVSFGCRLKNCISAVMITASHNPKEYNGFKVYWKDGGQTVPPHDKNIIKEVDKIEDLSSIKTAKINDPLIKFLDQEIDKKYIKKISSLKHYPQILKKGKDLKIIYSNLHGTGLPLIKTAFKDWGFSNLYIVKEQSSLDGNFPYAQSPNPEDPKTLELGIKYLLEKDADIFITTDPDADRVAVVINKNNTPVILSGNQLACLILDHLCKYLTSSKKMVKNAAFIKTIVTTELFSKIVKKYKKKSFDVLTGFKYIAEKINLWKKEKTYKFIFGAEESFGYLMEDFLRDKDGISTSCVIAEMSLLAKKNNKTLLDLLYDLYKEHGIFREKLFNLSYESDKDKMENIMNTLRKSSLKKIANYEILIVEDYLTKSKLNIKTNKKTFLKLPYSNVLRYWLTDNTKIVIRPSGTEPKIKIYIGASEINFSNIEEGIKLCDERIDSIFKAIKVFF